MQLKSCEIRRFWEKVNKTDDSNSCWLWIASLDRDGYGSLGIGGRTRKAHIISYLLYTGKSANGLDVCHSCNNKACVNPNHLYLGTRKKNMQDAARDGLLPEGSSHYKFVSTQEFKDKVFELRRNGVRQYDIAKELGVNQSHISRILSGKLGLERKGHAFVNKFQRFDYSTVTKTA